MFQIHDKERIKMLRVIIHSQILHTNKHQYEYARYKKRMVIMDVVGPITQQGQADKL